MANQRFRRLLGKSAVLIGVLAGALIATSAPAQASDGYGGGDIYYQGTYRGSASAHAYGYFTDSLTVDLAVSDWLADGKGTWAKASGWNTNGNWSDTGTVENTTGPGTAINDTVTLFSADYNSRIVGWCVEYGVYWNGYSGPHIRTGYACYNR